MLVLFASFLAGIALSAFAVWMLFRRRYLVATVNGSAGISFLSISVMIGLVFLNVHTYNRLTSEKKLAEIHIGGETEAGIPIDLKTEDHRQTYYIRSKEWQLDARFLKWKGWAYLLGTEPVVRLERLTERRPFQTETGPVSHSLVYQYPVLAEMGALLSDWFGLVDTYYGSAVYMPVAEGATYTVSATVSGLIARAENDRARHAVSKWINQ